MTTELAASRRKDRLRRLAIASAKSRGQNADEEGDQRRQDVVAQRDGDRIGEHADEVHRPDSDAHRGRAAEQPESPRTAIRRPRLSR